jgi:transposase
LSDEEWALLSPFIIGSGPRRGRPPNDHRRVLDAIFWISRTGSSWRDLPAELGNWNSVYRQFLRWKASGLWNVMLQDLARNGCSDALEVIDITIGRAHQHGRCTQSRDARMTAPPSHTRQQDDVIARR